MPVKLAQYRVTVGIFNNQKISRNLKFEEFPIWKCQTICLNMFQFVIHYYFTIVCVPYSRDSILKIATKLCILIFLLFHIFEIVFAWPCSLLVMLSGDVEINSGPKKKDTDCLSICHGNHNSIPAYDYSK